MLIQKLLPFLLILCLSVEMHSMHIIGGDLTYECTGEVSPGVMRYNFLLTVYRDCNSAGAPFDQQASIAIYRGNTSSASLFADFFAPRMAIDPIPNDTPECVQQFPSVCAEKTIYTFTRDLPVINESYIVVYQRCCRNNTIKNLLNPGDVGATYYIEVTPAAQQVCNSTPVFNNFPRTVICNNIPLFEDQSATDKDGDQLVYSFCSPLDGGGTILQGAGLNSCLGAQPIPSCGPPFDNVPFLAPQFTPTAPMGGNPVIGINGITGAISGTPNQLGQFVVGVCVQEFRNGMPLSTIRRDFQFNLADCVPDLVANIEADSVIGPQIFELTSCGPLTVKFKNLSTKVENIQEVRWEFNLQGTPFTSTDFDPIVIFPDTGTYRGVLYLNPTLICNDSAEIFVNIYPSIHADFSYTYDTCVAGPVNFTDLSTGEGGITQWDWAFGGLNEASNNQNPEFLYSTPGTKNVTLTVTDANGCKNSATKPITWQPAPPYLIIQPDKFLGCNPADIFFNNLSSPIDSTYFIVWDYGDGARDTGIISPTHTYTQDGIYNVSVFIRSPIGCEVADTFINWIRIVPSPTAAFDIDPDTLLTQFNNTVRFIDQSVDASRWGWKFGEVQTSTQQNPTVTFPDTGLVNVLLVVTHPQGCKDTVSRLLDIVPVVNYTVPNAFTPNGDSFNEIYLGKGFMQYAKEFSLTIWNRWGELIFEATDPNEGWNGTVKNRGDLCQDGVYVYVVKFKGPRGDDYEYKGYVNLIR